MAGYCGECNQHYDSHYTVHEAECEGLDIKDLENLEDRFNHEKKQQGWSNDLDENVWNKYFKDK